MKLIEKIFLFLLAIGIILKFNLIRGAGLLIITTSAILILIYGFFSFGVLNNIKFSEIFTKGAYNEISRLRLSYSIAGGLCLQILILGILFKLMWWHSFTIILLTGLISTFVILCFATIKFSKHKELFYKLILIRFIPYFVFALVIFFPSDLSIFSFQYRNHPAFLEAYAIHKAEPNNKEKFDKMEMEQRRAICSEEEFKRFYPEEK
jgi:hypothetical protein